jgi:transcriptional regulator with XRE-family HTH domain
VADYQAFFQKLGARIRELRQNRGYSQEDMMSFGFSTRHWQQIEAGRPITLTTLLRASEAFKVPLHMLLRGLGYTSIHKSRKPKTRRKSA